MNLEVYVSIRVSALTARICEKKNYKTNSGQFFNSVSISLQIPYFLYLNDIDILNYFHLIIVLDGNILNNYLGVPCRLNGVGLGEHVNMKRR